MNTPNTCADFQPGDTVYNSALDLHGTVVDHPDTMINHVGVIYGNADTQLNSVKPYVLHLIAREEA